MEAGAGAEILAIDKLAEPFFNRLRAEGRAVTGDSEWSALAKRKQLNCRPAWLRRLSKSCSGYRTVTEALKNLVNRYD